ncbi:unnamed protein product [Gordionus sp. m RMFG-2023]
MNILTIKINKQHQKHDPDSPNTGSNTSSSNPLTFDIAAPSHCSQLNHHSLYARYMLLMVFADTDLGCEIKTFSNGSLEERKINGHVLYLISDHEAGSMNKDYITFKNCNGTLNIYSERNDGFSFINSSFVLLNSDYNSRGVMNKKYRFNNKGTNRTIKGWRIANDQNNIFVHWRNY